MKTRDQKRYYFRTHLIGHLQDVSKWIDDIY